MFNEPFERIGFSFDGRVPPEADLHVKKANALIPLCRNIKMWSVWEVIGPKGRTATLNK